MRAKRYDVWLRADTETDPWALALSNYDLALLRIIRVAAPIIVTFPGDPTTVFEALADRQMPTPPPPPVWEVEILPDLFAAEDFTQSSPS